MSDRWLTFDCYGTLIDWNRGIASALSRLWPERDPAALLDAYHRVEPAIQAGGERTYREVMAEAVRVLSTQGNLPLEPGAEHSLPDSLPLWPAFPDVAPALRLVRAHGWSTAILSNTDPDLVAASVEQIGVPFDEIVTHADTGTYKPSHGHWKIFAERTGAAPARTIHVAQSVFHDVEPCALLGIRCIWINRLNESDGTTPRMGELPDLSELAGFLLERATCG